MNKENASRRDEERLERNWGRGGGLGCGTLFTVRWDGMGLDCLERCAVLSVVKEGFDSC